MKSLFIRRALIIAVATAALAVLVAVLAIEWRWTRRFDAPYPAVSSSQDPATLARGEYIVYGAAACAYCHVPRGQWPALDRGERLPLTGHQVFPLAAVVSYLRSRPAVPHAVPEHALSLFGKALMAFAISPAAIDEPHGPSPQGATVERGAYLANHVSSCVACHTDRGRDGALVGPPFAGGQRMDVAADPTRVYVTPNLTPDPESSPIGQWPEDAFVARFRMGPQVDGSPMPWGAFARMSDDDLRALYRYLRSLPPTRHHVGPAIQSAHLLSAAVQLRITVSAGRIG